MLQVLGRLHPALVHLPIALLLAALLAECWRPRKEAPSEAGFFCLALGTAGALCAALSGWLFAAHDPPGVPELLLRHRWSGVGTAVAASVTLVSAWRWRRSGAPRMARPTRAGLVLTCALVAASSHLGGSMVYGEGFVLEPLRTRAAPTAAATATTATATEPAPVSDVPAPAPPPAGAAAPVDFLTEIRPLLARRCFECHGDKKRPKGKLKLSDMAGVLAREPAEAAIVPGNAAASLIYQRLTLPPGHEDLMPPKDGPLPAEEIELVRRWLDAGAPWSAVAAAPAVPGEDSQAEHALVLDAGQRAARDAALERLRARGIRAQRVTGTSDEVEVDFGVAWPPAGDAELALLAGLEPCLVELSLARTAISDAGLAQLAGFGALRRLRLEHTAIGDAGCEHVAGLAELRSLDLFDTRVGDAGAARLGGLAQLQRLYAGETAIGAAALDELARARPGLVIERGRLP